MLRRASVFTRLFLLIALVLGVGQGLAAWQAHDWAVQNVVAAEGARAQAAAVSLALAIDGLDHERAAAAWPEADAFTTWDASDDAVRSLHERLAAAQAALGLASPVYTLRLRDDVRERVAGAPDQEHPDAMEFIATSAEAPYWRHRYQYKPEMKAVLAHGRPTRTAVYQDQHGTWVSAYAPVTAAEGHVVALLEVDAPLQVVLDEVRAQLIRQLGLSLSVFLGVLIAVGTIGRRLSAGILRVEQAASRIGAGDLHTAIQSGGLLGVGVLAQSLEDARSALKRKHERLIQSQQQLAERLVEAEAGIGPEARKRRLWLKKNQHRVQLSLGAGKVQSHSATLVDMCERGLVVQVPLGVPVDLPRGSLVAVRIKFEGQRETLVVRGSVKQRTALEGHAELLLGVAFATVLAALPPAFRRGVGPRAALRIQPASSQCVQLAIRGRNDAETVASDVLDISVTGAGVRVQVSESRVASWGRIVRVGVAHTSAPDTVSSFAEIVRVQGGPEGVVLGLFFLESDSTFERSLNALVNEADRLDLSRAVG